MKTLIVNADDFGFTRDVNRGIVRAHRDGILTATTLMANGRAFTDAVELAHANPSLDIGCHLVLVGGVMLTSPGREFPRTVLGLLRALARGEIPVREELEAQIVRIREAGLRPTHLDTHKHTHLLPPVLRAVAELSQKYSIPWVRRPFDYPLPHSRAPLLRRAASQVAGFARRPFHRLLAKHGCRTTDHFAGFLLTGSLHTEQLTGLLQRLPDGTTELMTHPGYCTEELLTSPTRLKHERQTELEALIAPEVRRAMKEQKIRLASYRDLIAGKPQP